jgi:hypothetical protein
VPADAAASAVSAADAAAPLQSITSGVIGVELARSCLEVFLHGKVAQQLHRWSAQGVANSMWACARLGVLDAAFFYAAAAAAPSWLRAANAVGIKQLAWACSVLQYKHEQLIAAALQRSLKLVQQRGRNQLPASEKLAVAAVVASAVASLDMQQLAGDVRKLVASTRVTHSTSIKPSDARHFREARVWLVQHQLLDGQGLAVLLSEQQLATGRAKSAVYHARQEQQQQ